MIGGILRDLLSLFTGDIGGGRGLDGAKDQAETQAERMRELTGALEDLTGTLERIHGIPATLPASSFLKPVEKTGSSLFELARKSSPGDAASSLAESGRGGKTTWLGSVISSAGGKISGLGDKLGGLSSTASKAVGGLSGLAKAAGVAGAVVGLVKVFYDLQKAAYNFAVNQSNANRELAQFSGRLAASFSRMDLQKLQQDISLARNTEGSAEALNDSIMSLRDTFQPLKEDLNTIKNLIGTGISTVIELRYKADIDLWNMTIGKVLEYVEKNLTDGGEGKFQPLEKFAMDWANVAGKGKFQPRDGLPPLQ